MHFTGTKSLPYNMLLLKHTNCLDHIRLPNLYNASSLGNNPIKLIHFDDHIHRLSVQVEQWWGKHVVIFK